jgi:hypothetical protein
MGIMPLWELTESKNALYSEGESMTLVHGIYFSAFEVQITTKALVLGLEMAQIRELVTLLDPILLFR